MVEPIGIFSVGEFEPADKVWNADAVILLLVVLVHCVCFLLLAIAYWSKRNELIVAARFPGLALFGSSVGAGISTFLMMGWLKMALESPIHCSWTLYMSYIGTPLFLAPYLLRACRVIVRSDPALRDKYGLWVTPRVQWTLLSLSGILFLPLAAYYQATIPRYSPSNEMPCCMFMEWKAFMGIGIGLAALFTCAFKNLQKVKDIIHISLELRVVCTVAITMTLLYIFIFFGFVSGWWPPSHKIHILNCTCMSSAAFFTLAVPWYSGTGGTGKVYVQVEGKDELSIETARWNKALTILEFPDMDELFAEVVESALCWESHSFLKEALAYQNGEYTDVAAQHAACCALLKKYIGRGSIFEVNISCAQCKQTMQVQDFAMFSELDEVARSKVMYMAMKEVAAMLDMNLMANLHKHPSFLPVCRKKRQEESNEEAKKLLV